jgi:hypothetical protein
MDVHDGNKGGMCQYSQWQNNISSIKEKFIGAQNKLEVSEFMSVFICIKSLITSATK